MKIRGRLTCIALVASCLAFPFQSLRADDAASVVLPSSSKKTTAEVIGYAVWYRVPIKSLAHRRAKEGEFTAAHNHLPLGTLVRVTRLANGESVLVRITDRGITNRRAKIDICWEAAEKLGMIREGFSRVRMEIIPEPAAANEAGSGSVAAH